MRVLIIDDNRTQREAVREQLRAAKYAVEIATSHAAALSYLEAGPPDVALLGWGPTSFDIVKRLRSHEQGRHCYVVALLDRQPATALAAMFEAGIDDFARTPVASTELLLRIEAPRRIRRWAKLVTSAAGSDLAADRDLCKLVAFKNLGAVVAEDLAQLLGSVSVAEGWNLVGEMRGATIPMSVTTDGTEIRISVVVQAALIKPLAGILLGDENADTPAVDDMLREIANTAGGALKRAAAAEHVTITTGIPVNAPHAPPLRNELTSCWTLSVDGGATHVGVIGEVRKQQSRRLPLGTVSEGMVVTQDLRNENGALLMPAGTRLTATAVLRMTGLLGPRFVVDVAQP